MYSNQNVISKVIVTADGETEFQVRFFRDEGVGIISTPTDRSYFLLDSADHWYDLIQEKYPPIMKCSCKNDWFHLTFEYTPREGTEDFREISIICSCTACQKSKRLPLIEIDYSPSFGLYECPITFCKQPKIKYKTYSLMGYWSHHELLSIANHLLGKDLLAYGWYWDPPYDKRCFRALTAEEVYSFLTDRTDEYLAIYFSEEPLDSLPIQDAYDGKGVYIPKDIWRKNNMIMLHGPITVIPYGKLYQVEFCSEYLNKEYAVVPKSASFCALTEDLRKYVKKLLKE